MSSSQPPDRLTVAICDGLLAGQEFMARDLLEICGCAHGGSQPKLASARRHSLAEIAARSPHISTASALEGVARRPLMTAFEPRPDCLKAASRRFAALPFIISDSTSGKATHHARLVAAFIHMSAFSMNPLVRRGFLSRSASSDDFSEVTFAVLALGRDEAVNSAATGRAIHKMMVARDHRRLKRARRR
jgi:hypothetical protein